MRAAELPREERDRYSRFFYRWPGGESAADCFDRVSLFLESLHRDFSRQNMSEDVVLVFSHGLLLRLFVMRWLHWKHEKFEETRNMPNCGLLELERKPSLDGSRQFYQLTPQATLLLFGTSLEPDKLASIARPSLRQRGGSFVEDAPPSRPLRSKPA
jgi:broad specificity phosphatase PhoE